MSVLTLLFFLLAAFLGGRTLLRQVKSDEPRAERLPAAEGENIDSLAALAPDVELWLENRSEGRSCSIADCGYDPATDPRGACCMAPPPEGEQGSWEKPSCENGKLAVSTSESTCWQGNECHGVCMTADHEDNENDCFGAIGWWHCTSVSYGSC